MEARVSEILENVLGLLGLEGSFEVTENEKDVTVVIETDDAGRLIGYKGETLDALQLLVNLMASKNAPEGEFKRVMIDVGGWRKNKEEDLESRAKEWAEEVIETQKEIALDPMPSWQRRIVHLVIEATEGVESESMGDGRDRHLVIRPAGSIKTSPDSEETSEKENEEVIPSEAEGSEPTQPEESADVEEVEPEKAVETEEETPKED